ncbi:unnamed protein product, partial [Nesidiocoris tenuis]
MRDFEGNFRRNLFWQRIVHTYVKRYPSDCGPGVPERSKALSVIGPQKRARGFGSSAQPSSCRNIKNIHIFCKLDELRMVDIDSLKYLVSDRFTEENFQKVSHHACTVGQYGRRTVAKPSQSAQIRASFKICIVRTVDSWRTWVQETVQFSAVPTSVNSSYRRRSGETSYLHFVKTATVPMAPYVTTLNFHDISNVHVQVRNWRYEVSPLRRRYILCALRLCAFFLWSVSVPKIT